MVDTMMNRFWAKYLAIVLFSVFSYKLTVAEDIVYTNREIIRNGVFENSLYEAWYHHRCGISSLVAKDGKRSMEMKGDTIHIDDRFFFQQLTIPTELQSATVLFDYRADEDYVYTMPIFYISVCFL